MDSGNSPASQDLEAVTARILQRITAEPAYRGVLYKILAFCETVRSSADVEREVLSYPEMTVAAQSPQNLLSWMVQVGAVEQVSVEDGDFKWCTTAAGRNAVRTADPRKRLADLLSGDASYRDIYLRVLRTCRVPQTRSDVEALLRDEPILENPKIYASYFIEALEHAGGLEWSEKWRATQAGLEFVNGDDSSESRMKNISS